MAVNKIGKHFLILGAGSDIALAFTRLLFNQWKNCHFYLLARNTASLQNLVAEGNAANHQIEVFHYDLLQPADLHFTNIEYCIVFAGWLPPDNSEPEKAMQVNATGIENFVNNLIDENLPL